MDELAQRIREALAALGGTCEEVAAKLRELGIRGVPGESCACPVYRYLRSLGIPVVNVDGFTVLTSTGLHMVPKPVMRFICAFDNDPDRYPDLIEAADE